MIFFPRVHMFPSSTSRYSSTVVPGRALTSVFFNSQPWDLPMPFSKSPFFLPTSHFLFPLIFFEVGAQTFMHMLWETCHLELGTLNPLKDIQAQKSYITLCHLWESETLSVVKYAKIPLTQCSGGHTARVKDRRNK